MRLPWGAGWNVWAEQTDSLSQRGAGWIQIYCESNQEALDNVIMAYGLAESSMLPVMMNYDAFFLSHTSDITEIPESGDVDAFLKPFTPEYKIDPDDPRMLGRLVGSEYYYEQRYVMHQASLGAAAEYLTLCDTFHGTFDREYDPAGAYRTDDAETILVTAGTITPVARLAVGPMRQSGKKVGLMKIRLFRPAQSKSWCNILKGAQKLS